MSTIRHLFWDFDGTLYNSYPQLHASFRSGLEQLGLGHIVSDEALMKLMKVSVFHAALWCAEHAGVDVQEIMASYRSFHKSEKDFPRYEGMEDCLRRLHEAGYHHYLYTHRDEASIVQLKADGLWELFEDAVTVSDGFPHKPAPDALLSLMERNHLTPDVCAMVGDRDIDIDAGHNAGMSGFLFDPEGFYPDHPAEIHVHTLQALTEQLLQPSLKETTSMDASIVYEKDVALTDMGGGVKRRILAYNDELMIVEVHFEVGGVGTLHTHPHTQCTYIQSGRFRFTIDGKETEVGPGDSISFPPEIVHGTLCLEAGVLLDIFSPMRKDFL